MQKKSTSTVLAMNLIILVLGMVLLTQFYNLLFQNIFSIAGWADFLNHLLQYNEVNSFKYEVIIFLKNTAPFSTYLFAGGIFISALACIMLLARFYVCIAVAIAFFVAWSLSWNDPGMWPFEFSFPAFFALLAGISMRSFSLAPQSVFLQLRFSTLKTFLAVIVLCALLYYVTFIAFHDPEFAHKVALTSTLTFFILCLVPFYLKKPNLEIDEHNRIDKYLDCMIVTIGSMLVLQVYINCFSGVFEDATFRENITYFAKNSNATWISQFLLLSAKYSHWILPLYAVFEIFLSISLTLLLVRGPVLLLAAGLLAVLAFSELGVSATWPPDPHNLTWEWELLFVTAVAIIIGVQKTLSLKENFSLKKLILGNPIGNYPSIPLFTAILISVISGIALYFIALTAHLFIGDYYQITAIYSGISLAVLIFILLITNKFRA